MPRTRRTTLAVLTGIALLSGGACNGPGADEVGNVAQSLEQLAPNDAAKACQLISEHQRTSWRRTPTPCVEALGQVGLPPASPVLSVDVYGHDARVVLGSDVVFLARFADGWRVTAARCTPQPEDRPYDCVISGS
jgi:hypothetical protein